MFTIEEITVENAETFEICKKLYYEHDILFARKYVTLQYAKLMYQHETSYPRRMPGKIVLAPVYSDIKWYDDNLFIKQNQTS